MRWAFLLPLLSLALAQGLYVTPNRVEFTLSPGEEREVVLRLGGEGPMAVSLMGLSMDGDRLALDPGVSCDHILPERANLDLEGKGELRLRVRAPEGEGTTPCLVRIGPAREGLSLGVGVPVYVTRKGTERHLLSIGILPDGRVVLENGGNTLLRLKGFVAYLSPQGEKRLQVEDFPLFPGKVRTLKGEAEGEGEVLVYLEGNGYRWTKRGRYR